MNVRVVQAYIIVKEDCIDEVFCLGETARDFFEAILNCYQGLDITEDYLPKD